MRAATGMNQIDFCRLIGVSANRYNQWEQGVTRPTVDAAAVICDKTGATLDWIFRGDPAGLPTRLLAAIPAEQSAS